MADTPPDRVIRIGGTLIEIWSGNCARTTLPTGRVLMAAPQDNAAYRQRAIELGYGKDTFRMCVEHETAHTMIACALGLPYSQTLDKAAQAITGTALHDREEAIILALQDFCNASGIDLLAAAESLGNLLPQ
jgi:hypothetical protein